MVCDAWVDTTRDRSYLYQVSLSPTSNDVRKFNGEAFKRVSEPPMTSWRIPGDVVFRDLDGEGVLLNLTTGMYYGLNPTGTVVWNLLRQGCSTSEIVSAIVARFDVDADVAAADVALLVGDLAAKGLVASG